MSGSATTFGNLYRLGYEAAAREVYRASRKWNRPRQVRVSSDGAVFASRAALDSQWTTVAGDLLGVYDMEIQINVIEDDMLAHFRELSQQRVAS